MIIKKNLFPDIPHASPDELSEELLSSRTFKIERIISQGHASPDGFWYDQEDNEWVVLLQGEANLRFEERNEPVVLHPGDYIHISAHCRHRIEWTDPTQDTIWLAVFYR